MWVRDDDIRANPQKIKCEGKRFTILHAGCSTGFLKGCCLLLDSKCDDRDYHKTMNGDIFHKWVTNQLLPALQKLNKKCIVVMDNAPYHSVLAERPPTSSSKKSQLNDWLQNKNILFDPKLSKKQLRDMFKPRLEQHEKK
jgi:hypothetical protein